MCSKPRILDYKLYKKELVMDLVKEITRESLKCRDQPSRL
jgi:hypothetical protein